ncbi:MAG: InlB B-repeat-containing protein [Lachnospiraceae bacterium]|nr:InlB B-repeat-containing protein [Lachnospiraceae bacterium]
MGTGRKKRFFSKGMAGALVVSLFFGMVGSHADVWAIRAQAAETENIMVDGDGIVALGDNHSAVVKADGSLWMWGNNNYGQLGDGTTTNRSNPVKVMENVKSVALGTAYSAAIKEDGSLWMWGINYYGQLGNGEETRYEANATPIKIMENVKSVALGCNHSAAIKIDGSLWTWGNNDSWQLGFDGSSTSIPKEIMKDIESISLGYSCSAVIKTDGSLWTFGEPRGGSLGYDISVNRALPKSIMHEVKSVSLKGFSGAAIKKDGSLWTWGMSENGNDNEPKEIMKDVKAVSLNIYTYNDIISSKGVKYYRAVIKEDNSLWMWGNNNYGQLGNGTVIDNFSPIKIMENIKAVSLGSLHSAVVKKDGSLWMWGDNKYGQLGDGTEVNRSEPVKIMSIIGITDPDAPDSTAIFIDEAAGPLIKVVDADGKPIKDATLFYNQKQFTTSEKGFAMLDNYQVGKELVISKANYVTKTVSQFTKSQTGMTTYALAKTKEAGTPETGKGGLDKLANLTDGIYLIKDEETIDLLTEEAQINTYYKKSLNVKFDIICKSHEKYDQYTLYSDDKKIASNSTGNFSNLQLRNFSVDKPVSIGFQDGNKQEIRKNLNLHVVNISPPVDQLYLGKDGLKITIPDNIPIIGGENLQVELDDLPAECCFKSDGTVEIGINIDKFMKDKGMEFHEIFPQLKKLNSGNVSSFLGKSYQEYSKSSAIKPDFTIIGYLESNVGKDNPLYLQGKLFVEFSLEYAHENQLSLGPVPVVVEISIEGKVNADGSIKWSAVEGLGGSVGVGGGIELGVYGGVGIAKLASGGIYGSGEFGLHYVILPEDSRGLDEVYIDGEIGLEGKVFGQSYKCSLINGKWYIISNGVISRMSADQKGWEGVSITDYDAYSHNVRDYLTAEGSMPEWTPDNEPYTNGSIDETVLQNAVCLDTVPQVIRMENTVMLFYLTDAGTVRNAANRSILVYSLWNETEEEWEEPKAVLDDGTADYSPDFYTDGEKIYVVWQDAKESLADNLSLEETALQMTLHAAVYDAEQKQFVDLGVILSENDLFQQKPQIVADDNGVSVYWYENAQDNVLGLSGSNRIYRASLTDQRALTEGIQVMNFSGEEETEDTNEEESNEESPEVEESVSENTVSAFRKFVALTEEIPVQEILTIEESVSENTTPEDNPEGEENDAPPVNPGEENGEENKEPEEKEPAEKEPSDKEDVIPEKPEETVSDNTLSEETVSGNTISENTIQVDTYGMARQTDQPWAVTFLQEERNCIFSADAGRMNEKTGYAFAAGTMDQSYNVEESKVVFLEQGQSQERVLKSGTAEKVEFSPVYADETLTWFEAGDIRYIDGDGSTAALFGENRIPSWSYTLLSDGSNPEVFFPVNAGGKANLYRIGRENEEFFPSLQVTDQDDYIQYADGFINGNQTILVYNKMEVNDELEEINNSLCTGKIAHSYYDIAMHSAGSMILYNEETGEDELKIAALLYNNGTVKAENLNLALCGPDGSVLKTVPIDTALEPGEEKDVSVVFPMDLITQETEYMVFLSGAEEANRDNNSVTLTLGSASLHVEAKTISVADTRTIQAGIRNTGVTACGGTVSVRDSVTGKEYCSGTFEPIEKGKTAIVEAELSPSVFKEKAELALEVIVIPDQEKVDTVRDFVVVYAPSYEVNFVTDTGITTVYADYGTRISFPENPVKEGKHFIGWYDAENPSAGTFYTEETPITKDLTLYACFADEERAQIPLSECSVSSIPMQYYTGGQLKPKVTVKWGSEVLKADKDYKVTYQNNKEQGEATAIITAVTGNGKRFTGSIERKFSIMYPTSKVSVKAIPAVNFTGEAHTPEPIVTYQKKTLVKGKDYTVSYFNNRNAGTAGVTITGKGKFSGEKKMTFQIRGTAISGMKFDKIPDVTYNGKNTRPIVTVRTKDGKTQLMPGSDYRLVYENTINKGTATVTVIGNGNYTGMKKLTYRVVAKPLVESMVSVEQPSMASAAASLVVAPEKAEYIYTGKPIKPVLTVTDEAAGDTALVLNKDYTVSYRKNKAVGEAQITVKGKGNYSGTLKIPFTIKPVNLAEAETEGTIDVRVNDIAYTGKALKPAVQVYETVNGKDRKLSGSAYTLSYTNNMEKGTGTVTVTGKEKSGYTGTVTANFRIVDKAKLLSASSIKIDAISAQTFTGSAVEPALHIVDKSDKNKEVTLEKGMHYEVTYRNNVNAGKATVTVRGIGNYAGSRDVTFKINKCAIADKDVLGTGFTVENPANMKYTGYALKPNVVIKDKGTTLAQGKDYKLSYKNNTKIGTASVTVQGIGNYSGSYKAISFQITAWDYNTLTAEMEDQIYTGKALKPQVKFYMTGENGREEILLKPNTAAKIAYKDNKNAGTATAVITGKGELDKITPITVTFEIEQADLSVAVVSRIPNQTLRGTAVKPVPKVKVGKNSLKAGRDFTVSYLRNGVKGEATVIIRGIGNYTGECRKTFIVQ